jgi:hypothetical protein
LVLAEDVEDGGGALGDVAAAAGGEGAGALAVVAVVAFGEQCFPDRSAPALG